MPKPNYRTMPLDDLLAELNKCIDMGMPPSTREATLRLFDLRDIHKPRHTCADRQCPYTVCSCGEHPCCTLRILEGIL